MVMFKRARDGIRNLLVSMASDWHKRSDGRPLGPEAHALRTEGFVVFPNFITRPRCEQLRSKALSLARRRASGHTPRGAYVTIRGGEQQRGPDSGMVDIRDAQLEIPATIALLKDRRLLETIADATGFVVEPLRAHVYVSRSITNTRGFHADRFRFGQFKALLYLTDVKHDDDGPYAYVAGSHRFSWTKYQNLLSNLLRKGRAMTDIRKVPKDRVRHFRGPAGTLVLSDQNGFHRGVPQEVGRERVVLVLVYLARPTGLGGP